MIYHVSPKGCDRADGSENTPFKTINRAARIAAPGDTVKVHEGVYRETVVPRAGGVSENRRIVYEAAEGERAVIKGSEVIKGWKALENNVWFVTLPNAFFGDYNPFDEPLYGDWFRTKETVHTADVYLNGKSFFEALSKEELANPAPRKADTDKRRSYRPMEYLNSADTVYLFWAEVDEDATKIFIHLNGEDPNAETVEVNVRPTCVCPASHGINYITLRGFEIAHAATPWNPPSGAQLGMVNPNFSLGWIIEDCDLHDAKTSAICLGTEASTGDNLATRFGGKSSHTRQMEAVFIALSHGWSKETVGSHTVRRCQIHDCGENGIVGHLGCIFSCIENNHIYNIGMKFEFVGDEIAGIKFHTPIDTVIKGNVIHHTTLGIWLDWESQGTRLTKNLFYENGRDMEIEVCHGPAVIDHNVFLSDYSIDNYSEGTAFVNNLITGVCRCVSETFRHTPYHMPHSTNVLAISQTWGGDDRFYGNLVLGKHADIPQDAIGHVNAVYNFGAVYDRYSTPEEYAQKLAEEPSPKYSLNKYATTPQPVYINENVYAGEARPFRGEKNFIKAERIEASLKESEGNLVLTLTLPKEAAEFALSPITSEKLGAPRLSEATYENPDGSPLDLATDFLGHTADKIAAGPFAALKEGKNEFIVGTVKTGYLL